jgi:hypothetical protein
MSYLILIADRNRWQFPVNIAALPLAVLILFLCALAVRREWILMMILSIIGFIAGEVYFIYQVSRLHFTQSAHADMGPTLQLTRIYASSTSYLYNTVRLTLTFFSVFAIVSLQRRSAGLPTDKPFFRQLFLLLTLINSIICLSNFGKGEAPSLPLSLLRKSAAQPFFCTYRPARGSCCDWACCSTKAEARAG